MDSRKATVRNKNICEDSLYLKEPFPSDVQIELVKLAKQGSKEAKDLLVESNLRFVRRVVSKYPPSDEYTTTDLVNEGARGIISAIDKFNVDKGIKFMSFAVWWIKHYISYYIRCKSRLIHQPHNKQEYMGFSYIPLDSRREFGDSDSQSTFGDSIIQTTFSDSEENLESKKVAIAIEALLNDIPEDESMVIRLRCGFTKEIMTFEEISQETQIHRKKLYRIHERGIKRLRKNITFSPHKEDLLQYLQTE